MYLLNPDKTTEKTEGNIFTFHYVSIKSEIVETAIKARFNLHSTMYLLNRYILGNDER